MEGLMTTAAGLLFIMVVTVVGLFVGEG